MATSRDDDKTTDKTTNTDRTAGKTEPQPQPSAEELSRQAMGKVPPSAGGDGGNGGDGSGSGNAVVPEAGGDPDSVQRVIKHLPKDLQERLGGSTPEEVAAQRAAYGEEINAARNPQGPRATDNATDEEMANRTGQPIGDGKSTGAPSADDPGSGLREGKLTAGDDLSNAGQSRRAAGVSGVRGRSATPAKSTTAEEK